MTCPTFEELSQFVDAELSPVMQSELTAHLAECMRCANLAMRLARDVDLAGATRNGGIVGSGCVGAESAVAYLLGDAGAEAVEIEAHLRQCDACVEQVVGIRRRLRRAAEATEPVPAAVELRARAAVSTDAPTTETVDVPRRTLLHRLTRLPILVPAALAAGALFTVVVESQWSSSAPREQMRSLPQRTIEVTAVEATARTAPHADAAALAKLSRGEVLQLRGEESGWYHVALSDGREGWIERHACE